MHKKIIEPILDMICVVFNNSILNEMDRTKKIMFFLITLLISGSSSFCQQEKLEIEGAIQIGNSSDPTPDVGTIRWTGSDFEGWNGIIWASLTGGAAVGSVTDASGITYKTVKIGGQEWMAENLRTFKYNDNSSITLITNQATWRGLSTGAWTGYNNDPGTYDVPYGKLYNWFAVETGNLCPTGWKVPSDSDWTTLSNYLGGLAIAGGKMKETGTTHWFSPNVGATNSSVFTAIPGGYRVASGSFDFISFGYGALFWSSTPNGSDAWDRSVNTHDSTIFRFDRDKNSGLSIRCIKG
jgi:uncharacterized protein (TIGR02145 family)